MTRILGLLGGKEEIVARIFYLSKECRRCVFTSTHVSLPAGRQDGECPSALLRIPSAAVFLIPSYPFFLQS